MSEQEMSTAIRVLAMDAVQQAQSGHPGLPMGAADVVSVLFNRFMQIDPSTPDWPDRDRFVLSAGHGSMLIYALHHLLGYADMPMSELQNFRQWGARTAGHPEYGHALGIETTTGPLGQGITNAVGMALAERMQNARFGDALSSHFTYVLAGDGCLMEGISQEAIDLAGHLGLGRLIVLWDDNAITIDGSTNVATSVDQKARFAASNWHVQSVDGHDFEAINEAIKAARDETTRPSMIACKTIIGFGAPNKQGSHDVHGAPLGEDEIRAAREYLRWPHAPFEIPEPIYAQWADIAKRGKTVRKNWEQRLAASQHQSAFEAAQKGIDQNSMAQALQNYRDILLKDKPKVATRKASQMALEVINATTPLTIGGSADLTGSNLTKTSQTAPIAPHDFAGRYIHYGIREHAMAAVMNGIALHGPFRPYGGTFLVFADYMRGAMRLSALMALPVTYVLTHDSIGLGEDGPTHQPVETLASLRAMPNLHVFRPADAVETAESWELALRSSRTPCALALSRQNLPTLRQESTMQSDRGAYLIKPQTERDITIIATGSEVEIALKAADELSQSSIHAAVVSAPCFELFAEQSAQYRQEVLGDAPRIGVEAAIRQGWDGLILRPEDGFIGMESFGASAPAQTLYDQFAITPEHIAKRAKSLLK